MARVKTAEEMFESLSLKAVTAVANRVINGSLAAYDGIEAAREIRDMMLAAHYRLAKGRPAPTEKD